MLRQSRKIEKDQEKERGGPFRFLDLSIFLDFLSILFDFIDSSIDVHDLPNVLEARKIRKLVPKSVGDRRRPSGNVGKHRRPSETVGNRRKPMEIVGNPGKSLETLGNHQKSQKINGKAKLS